MIIKFLAERVPLLELIETIQIQLKIHIQVATYVCA